MLQELEAAEIEAAKLQEQKKAAIMKAEQRRQVKNCLIWQREAVRRPLDFNPSRVKVLERLGRARQLLVAANPELT